eukprot:4694680-Pyramimonas_sp.AAC.1
MEQASSFHVACSSTSAVRGNNSLTCTVCYVAFETIVRDVQASVSYLFAWDTHSEGNPSLYTSSRDISTCPGCVSSRQRIRCDLPSRRCGALGTRVIPEHSDANALRASHRRCAEHPQLQDRQDEWRWDLVLPE